MFQSFLNRTRDSADAPPTTATSGKKSTDTEGDAPKPGTNPTLPSPLATTDTPKIAAAIAVTVVAINTIREEDLPPDVEADDAVPPDSPSRLADSVWTVFDKQGKGGKQTWGQRGGHGTGSGRRGGA